MIPQQLLTKLSDSLDRLSETTQALARAELENLEYSSVSELREKTIEILNRYSLASGEIAGGYGASFFDEVMAENGEEREGVNYTFASTEANDRAVRGLIGDVLTGGSTASFFDAIVNRLDYNIRRTSNECVLENIKNRGKHLKFARVPTGFETCVFCFMLASRGFVYWTKESAGENNHYHSNCRCRIVPGFDDLDPDTQVEGYEPSKLYKQYEDCYKAIKTPSGYHDYDLYKRQIDAGKHDQTWKQWKNNRLVKELRSRDTNWLWTGDNPTVEYTTKDVEKRVTKTENDTATRLSEHGRKCVFKKDYEEVIVNGVKQRKGLADLEDGTELKAIIGSKSAWGAVNNHLENAEGKRDVKDVVFDLTDMKHLKEDDVIEQLKSQIEGYNKIKDLYVLLKDGGLYRIT